MSLQNNLFLNECYGGYGKSVSLSLLPVDQLLRCATDEFHHRTDNCAQWQFLSTLR